VIAQGEIWWADMPAPAGSGPGFRRPVLIVQGDSLNFSRIATVVCVPLTTNLRWAEAPGNALLKARATGLPKDSVANASLIIALDRGLLTARAGKVTRTQLCTAPDLLDSWMTVLTRPPAEQGGRA
jgi:mRNA interferase MazF